MLERNRRVAKAYARAPVVTVNGSEEGFDGFRIGKFRINVYNLIPAKFFEFFFGWKILQLKEIQWQRGGL